MVKKWNLVSLWKLAEICVQKLLQFFRTRVLRSKICEKFTDVWYDEKKPNEYYQIVGLNTSLNVKCIEKIFKIVFHSILTAKITENSHWHSFIFFNYPPSHWKILKNLIITITWLTIHGEKIELSKPLKTSQNLGAKIFTIFLHSSFALKNLRKIHRYLVWWKEAAWTFSDFSNYYFR